MRGMLWAIRLTDGPGNEHGNIRIAPRNHLRTRWGGRIFYLSGPEKFANGRADAAGPGNYFTKFNQRLIDHDEVTWTPDARERAWTACG